jgi:hypothetical protein
MHARASPDGLWRLLDPAFGLIAWAIHLLVIYIAAAVACARGFGAASEGASSGLLASLVGVTLVAAAIVIAHGVSRYRRDRAFAERNFRWAITVGMDAIGALAILWQLFPLLIAPVCR